MASVKKYSQASKIKSPTKIFPTKNPLQKSKIFFKDIFAQIGLSPPEELFFNRGHDIIQHYSQHDGQGRTSKASTQYCNTHIHIKVWFHTQSAWPRVLNNIIMITAHKSCYSIFYTCGHDIMFRLLLPGLARLITLIAIIVIKTHSAIDDVLARI